MSFLSGQSSYEELICDADLGKWRPRNFYQLAIVRLKIFFKGCELKKNGYTYTMSYSLYVSHHMTHKCVNPNISTIEKIANPWVEKPPRKYGIERELNYY